MASYKLKRPCTNCPFRTDVPAYLRRDRAIEISHSLANGGTFPCHKTTHLDERDDDYDGDYIEMGGEQFCAGAMIMMEKMEQPNQIMRVAERIGVYKHSELDMTSPVVGSFDEFVAHHSEEAEVESECCSVCGPNCVAPAGYMVGGSVVPASFDPEDVGWCNRCGEPVCVECVDFEGRCNWCVEDEDDD